MWHVSMKTGGVACFLAPAARPEMVNCLEPGHWNTSVLASQHVMKKLIYLLLLISDPHTGCSAGPA